MPRQKRHPAPLQLAQNECVRRIAEGRLHHIFAHSRKSGHGVQAAASDDANLRCLQLSRSSSGCAAARQPCQLFAAGPIHNFTLAEPKYIVPPRYSPRSIAAFITPADDISRISDSPGSVSPEEAPEWSFASTPAISSGASDCTLTTLSRSLRASSSGNPSLTKTPVPEIVSSTSPSLVE